MFEAIGWGHVLLGIVLITLALTEMAVSDKQRFLWDLNLAADGLLTVYVPYSLVYATAMLLRTVPSIDVKSITSTVLFGPLVFLRPSVAVLGVVYAVYKCPHLTIAFLGIFVIALILMFERFLEWRRKRVLPVL
jgi:hypothetical protein